MRLAAAHLHFQHFLLQLRQLGTEGFELSCVASESQQNRLGCLRKLK